MLEVEHQFYMDNREALRAQYLGKRLLIVKDKILGVYDSDLEALSEAKKTMKMGTFFIKYIPVDPDEEYIRLRTSSA
jgi:hypothetical protein